MPSAWSLYEPPLCKHACKLSHTDESSPLVLTRCAQARVMLQYQRPSTRFDLKEVPRSSPPVSRPFPVVRPVPCEELRSPAVSLPNPATNAEPLQECPNSPNEGARLVTRYPRCHVDARLASLRHPSLRRPYSSLWPVWEPR